MKRSWLAISVAALFIFTMPALAQQSLYGQDSDGDGLADGYEDANGNGVMDGEEGGGPGTGGMEAECIASARPEICLSYFQLNCQNYGFPLACNMANLGGSCVSGDSQACQYFAAILQANKECYFGSQRSCAFLADQPLLRQ